MNKKKYLEKCVVSCRTPCLRSGPALWLLVPFKAMCIAVGKPGATFDTLSL